jgi:murein L,D-transpeptidase YafK
MEKKINLTSEIIFGNKSDNLDTSLILDNKNNEKEINLTSEIIFGNKSDNLDTTENFFNFINKKLINKIIKEFEKNKQEKTQTLKEKENQNLLEKTLNKEFKELNQLKINEINNRIYIEIFILIHKLI